MDFSLKNIDPIWAKAHVTQIIHPDLKVGAIHLNPYKIAPIFRPGIMSK